MCYIIYNPVHKSNCNVTVSLFLRLGPTHTTPLHPNLYKSPPKLILLQNCWKVWCNKFRDPLSHSAFLIFHYYITVYHEGNIPISFFFFNKQRALKTSPKCKQFCFMIRFPLVITFHTEKVLHKLNMSKRTKSSTIDNGISLPGVKRRDGRGMKYLVPS